MPTLRQIRREMLNRAPALGRVLETPSSITTTTSVFDSLKVGTWSPQKFTGMMMVRADAASVADRLRQVSNYASATGTLTHAGTNYSDTTAGTELYELHVHETYLYDLAINLAIQQLRREDRSPLATVMGSKRYWLHEFDWIKDASDVTGVYMSLNPVFSKNRYMEKWNSYDSSGNLTPDHWTLAGASATMARESTIVETGKYSVKVTRSGTNATFIQSVPLLVNGVSGEDLRGRTITVVARVLAEEASVARLRINDGSVTSSSYHTGDGGWEELSVTAAISSTAASLSFGVEVNTTNSYIFVDQCYLVETLDDGVRLDAYEETPVAWELMQEAGTMWLDLPQQSINSQYIVASTRPYPGFVEARLRSGAADADTTDAPLEQAAVGGIARLYEMLAARKDENTDRYQQLADEWGAKFGKYQAGHTKKSPPQIMPMATPLGPARGRRL